jgi:hypothetical protein
MEGYEFSRLPLHAVDTEDMAPPPPVVEPAQGVFALVMNKLERLFIFLTLVLQLLLATRFMLRFFVLSSSIFANGVYLISDVFVYPFVGLLPDWPCDSFVIETVTLVAILVYAVLALLVLAFLRILR